MHKKYLLLLVLLLAILFLNPVQGEEKEDGIVKYMKQFHKEYTITSLTPTVCSLGGFEKPASCTAPVCVPVIQEAEKILGKNRKIEKILIFCPDAIGDFLVPFYPASFEKLRKCNDLVVLGTNVMPSVTPVCFGSIFTGAPPEVHGIIKYSKPIIKIGTLFDSCIKANKKVVICAVRDCSIDRIFRERKMDYNSFDSDEEAFEFTKRLLNEADYDLILCYDGGYDSTMHATGTRSPQSIQAMNESINRYEELVRLTDIKWSQYNRLTIFAPDHGAHDLASGKGSHGTATANDMLVNHYYRIRAKK